MIEPIPETIVCVDCGGTCHRLGRYRTEAAASDAIVAYRCEDCLDRWDLDFGEADSETV